MSYVLGAAVPFPITMTCALGIMRAKRNQLGMDRNNIEREITYLDVMISAVEKVLDDDGA